MWYLGFGGFQSLSFACDARGRGAIGFGNIQLLLIYNAQGREVWGYGCVQPFSLASDARRSGVWGYGCFQSLH